MDLADSLGIVRRRWLSVLLCVLLCGAGAGAALVWVPATYEATGQVLLLPPVHRLSADQPANPYLNLPDALTLTAGLLASEVAGRDTQRLLEASGMGEPYTAAVLPGTGPVVTVTVTGADAGAVVAQRDRLLLLLRSRLDDLQTLEQVASGQRIAARDISAASLPREVHTSRTRAALLAVAVALGLGTSIVVLLDRRDRRGALVADEHGATASALGAGPGVVAAGRFEPDPEPALGVPVVEDDGPTEAAGVAEALWDGVPVGVDAGAAPAAARAVVPVEHAVRVRLAGVFELWMPAASPGAPGPRPYAERVVRLLAAAKPAVGGWLRPLAAGRARLVPVVADARGRVRRLGAGPSRPVAVPPAGESSSLD